MLKLSQSAAIVHTSNPFSIPFLPLFWKSAMTCLETYSCLWLIICWLMSDFLCPFHMLSCLNTSEVLIRTSLDAENFRQTKESFLEPRVPLPSVRCPHGQSVSCKVFSQFLPTYKHLQQFLLQCTSIKILKWKMNDSRKASKSNLFSPTSSHSLNWQSIA